MFDHPDLIIEREKMVKVSFPVAVNATEECSEIRFGHITRPIHPNTSWQEAQFETWMHRCIWLSDGADQVALANDSSYCHDVTPLWQGGLAGTQCRLTLLRAPTSLDPDADLDAHAMSYHLVVGADLARAREAGGG